MGRPKLKNPLAEQMMVRLTAEWDRRAKTLARESKLTPQELVRQLLARAWDERTANRSLKRRGTTT